MSQCINNMKIYTFFFILVGASCQNSSYEDRMYKDAVRFVDECGPKTITLCLKEKALKFIERLPNNIDIGNGIRIKQSDSERNPREYTTIVLPEEAKEREAVLDRVLIDRLFEYLNSHTLELKIPMLLTAEEVTEEARKGQGGGGYGGGGYGGGGGGKKGKGGKKGGMGTIMMMFMLKSATLYALGLKAVGALAFKALLVAKVALTIASIIALKKIVESNKGTATYEVIAHTDHHEHDRIFNPSDIVYRGYKVGS